MIHVPQDVADVRAYFSDLLEPDVPRRVKVHLTALAERLHTGLAERKRAAHVIVRNWHPELAGQDYALLAERNWTQADARVTVAREHGFTDWAEIPGDLTYDSDFKVAVHFLLSNDPEGLRTLLTARPELAQRHSVYGHGATLLHYAMANGTETRAQVVPERLPEMVRLLLSAGANPDARMKVYGGAFDALALLTSGGHPYAAEVGEAIEALLT